MPVIIININMDIVEDLILTLSPLGEYPPMEADGEDGLSDEDTLLFVVLCFGLGIFALPVFTKMVIIILYRIPKMVYLLF